LNSAIEYTLQVADYDNIKQRAAAYLFAFIVREPCFDQLRTKEQLGYIVFSGIKKQTGVLSFRIIVQSERHPIHLEHRVEDFLKGVKDLLRSMPLTEFVKFKKGLASKLTEKDKNLAQESKRYWSQVNARYYDFTSHCTDAEAVLSMDPSDILQFYENCIAVESPLRRKLSVHLVSQKCSVTDGDIQQTLIKDTEEEVALFKFRMELSKAAQPVKPLASYSAN
jgi:insulysin